MTSIEKLQKLKTDLIELAVRGKLVEQRQEEGTAQELYEKIQQERKKLISEGKLKKEKPLPDISGDKIPFVIPKSWKYVYIGDIFLHNTGKALKSSDQNGVAIEYLTTSNVYWDRVVTSNLRVMYFKEYEIERCSLKKGDLLVCEGGDCGRAHIWEEDKSVCIQNHLHRLRSILPINVKFYYYIFLFYKQTNRLYGKGIGIQSLSSNVLHQVIVPLPSLEEQKRIVETLETKFKVIDKAIALLERKADLDKKIKEKILQLAIQGKLVEQRPEEGTAHELFEKIQQEKQKLIAEGKLKKEKPLPDISDDEIPLYIPSYWKVVRFAQIIDIRDGTHDSPKYNIKGVPLVTSKNLQNGKISLKDIKYISEEDASKINERSNVDNEDILLAMIGTIGNPVLVKKEFDFCIKNIALFKHNENLHSKFIFYLLMYRQFYYKKNARGALQSFISLTSLRNDVIFLPPLEEQKRIADKIEQLFNIIDWRLNNIR